MLKQKVPKILKILSLQTTLTKSLRRGSGRFKVDYFLLRYSLPPLEFKYFSWSCNILNKFKPGKNYVQKVQNRYVFRLSFKLHIKQES